MTKEKYAVEEYERRFLLRKLPEGLSHPRVVRDLYIAGTRLRVRSVEAEDGVFLERKLGQKKRIVDDDPFAVQHTSLYLDESEFRILSSLSGRRLTKTRWPVDVGGWPGVVDVFQGELVGLEVVEVDIGGPESTQGFKPPDWLGPEITQNHSFSGGVLAGPSAIVLENNIRSVWESE